MNSSLSLRSTLALSHPLSIRLTIFFAAHVFLSHGWLNAWADTVPSVSVRLIDNCMNPPTRRQRTNCFA
jgi:hypothetical protein